MSKCGTYGGYQAHRRRGEDACNPCREANTTYQREYRRHPDRRVVARDQSEAYTRASAELRVAHKSEFDRIYDRIKSEYPTLEGGDS